MNAIDWISHSELFGPFFAGPSWDAWRVALKALFVVEMTDADRGLYKELSGGRAVPDRPIREASFCFGRRSGKSRIAAMLAVYLAVARDYRSWLAPGEVATIMLIASDRAQARTLMRYVTGLVDAVPALVREVVERKQESISFGRVVIEVHTASFRAVRGYTVAAAICDEIAYWRDEASANPDEEILAALRPAMVTIPESLLLCISTPHSRRGAFWRAFVDHHGPDAKDPRRIFLQSPTSVMNPTIDSALIEQDLLRDEPRARAEWLAEFRRDIEGYVSREAVEAVVVPGRRELSPVEGLRYSAFVDPSGGSSDSMTLAVCHAQDEVMVVDAVRERRPPFNPSEVVNEFAQLLKHYGVSRVEGDRYAGEWPRERFGEHGVHYEVTRKPKNDIYLQALPLINSGQVELLDDPRLIAQLCDLERRTARGGRESIDHPPRGHDDLANAVAGAVVRARERSRREEIVFDLSLADTGTRDSPWRI